MECKSYKMNLLAEKGYDLKKKSINHALLFILRCMTMRNDDSCCCRFSMIVTMVNVYVDLLVFTRIAGTS